LVTECHDIVKIIVRRFVVVVERAVQPIEIARLWL